MTRSEQPGCAPYWSRSVLCKSARGTSGLIQSGDSQIVRSSSSSHDESGNYGQGHAGRSPSALRRLCPIANAPQKHVWRAKIILATADGCGTSEIMRRSGKAKPVVWRWQARFWPKASKGSRATRRANPASRRCRRPRCSGWSIWRSLRRRVSPNLPHSSCRPRAGALSVFLVGAYAFQGVLDFIRSRVVVRSATVLD